MKFIIYLIKRVLKDIMNSEVTCLLFIFAAIACVVFCNFELLNWIYGVEKTTPTTAAFGTFLLLPEAIVLYLVTCYIPIIYDDYKKVESNEYVEKIESKRGSDHV